MGLDQWSRTEELLTYVVEEIRNLRAVTIAAHSERGRVPRVQPLPRPKTALERLEEREAMEIHRSIVRQVLPNRG
ncbi:hypothetical protein GCM10012275_52720 [Longimycelium tulufanense]|uniref:Uncharacterized protein n=1 Tax=Longimycelium tulufanense TaxID=907463 RepID=A0A8J3CIY4_9PSEU|nr:hypothetical protein [Longimycelium tulufanense]GGM75489.1 hypothetical protein GCM10012275_52720 [Longimycelium tulufanense]